MIAFIASRLNHAMGSIDRFQFACGATGSISDYRANLREPRHVIAGFTWQDGRTKKRYSLSHHATGRNARREALIWLEEVANA